MSGAGDTGGGRGGEGKKVEGASAGQDEGKKVGGTSAGRDEEAEVGSGIRPSALILLSKSAILSAGRCGPSFALLRPLVFVRNSCSAAAAETAGAAADVVTKAGGLGGLAPFGGAGTKEEAVAFIGFGGVTNDATLPTCPTPKPMLVPNCPVCASVAVCVCV